MVRRVRCASVFALCAGLTWGCGGERLTTSHVPESGESIGQPAGKLALNGMTRAVVVASVMDGGTAVSGATVQFARSVSGRAVEFKWSGTTNVRGQAYVEIAGAGATGYYRARATRDGSEIGSWSSVPVNSGYQSSVDLPVGGKAIANGAIALTPGGLPETITIGVALPLTGPQVQYGGPAMEGLDFAREEINGSTKLGGARIEFIVEDTRGAVDAGAAAFNKLIHQDGVSAIVGPGVSFVAKEIFPIAQRNEVVTFAPISAAAGLSAIGDYIFRAALNVDALVPGAVRETQEKLRYQRVAMMVDSTDVYSVGLDAALRGVLAELGIEIMGRETFATGETSFTDQMTRVKALNPHAVFVSCLAVEQIPILIQAREVGIPSNIPMILPDLTMAEVEVAGDAAERAITITTWSTVAATPGNHSFVDRYGERYGSEPGPWAALSYASLHLLADAIADAGATDAGGIKDELAAVKDVDTILGRFSFDAVGDAVYDPIVLIVRNGAFEVFE